MISYFFYILIIVVFCLPIGGFLLNSKETDPFQLYKTMVGDRNFFKENSEHQQSLSEQRRDTRYLMERVKDSQRLARMQQQDQGRKLERLREEQRSRQRQALNSSQAAARQAQDLIRQQQERSRDLNNRYKDLMAARRSMR